MKVLQLDVEKLAYEVLRPEASVYEDTKEKHGEVEDALVLWICVEKGDTNETGNAALKDAAAYMKQVGRKKIVIYPFAHLSNNLAEPKEAMRILEHMYKSVPNGLHASKAPFGWTKKFDIRMKGHPLAEQAKSYDAEGRGKKTYKKAKPVSINTAIVKKSDWSGLPDTDHRTIGEKLDLYSFQEVSPAMVYWHANGFIIYKQLIDFVREKEAEYGYQEISTPGLANIALWHMSGHDEHYKDNMFTFESQLGEIGLKPMNCPSAILVYKSRKWSYRELPFRTATFDKLYRSELSGAVTGLLRVKELTMDDAHIFLREDQVGMEMSALLKMVREIYATFGLKYAARLSTMPDDHAGNKETWGTATAQLKSALGADKMKYVLKEKEGSFYAPKIDFDIFDSQGRAWQGATIQLDYQMPQRFRIEYIGEDGKAHMPVIIHRAILGSLERFIAIMVEHYQGKFPTWLAPVQASVVSISDQTSKYADAVYGKLAKERVRARIDTSNRTLEYKLRQALSEKVPYIVIVGKKEEEKGLVTVRSRSGIQKTGIKLEEFLKNLKKEIADRANATYF